VFEPGFHIRYEKPASNFVTGGILSDPHEALKSPVHTKLRFKDSASILTGLHRHHSLLHHEFIFFVYVLYFLSWL